MLDGFHVHQGEGVDFGIICPIGPVVSMVYFATEMYLTRV